MKNWMEWLAGNSEFVMYVVTFVLLVITAYKIDKSERTGTKQEKTANRCAMILAVKVSLLLTTIGAMFALIQYVGDFLGLLNRVNVSFSELNVSVLVLCLSYFCGYSYYMQSEQKQKQLKQGIFGRLLDERK